MDSSLPALLALLGSLLAGGSDLLDAVPTRTYWDRRGVDVTVDSLTRQLEPPAGDLDADLKLIASDEVDAARSAALRVVERGPAVLPQLKELAAGTDPAAAAAARQVVVTIERRPKANEVRRLMAIRALGELKDPKALPALEAAGHSPEPFAVDYAAAAIARVTNRPATRPTSRAAAGADAGGDVWLLPASCRAVAQFKPGTAGWPTGAALAAGVPDAARRDALADAVTPVLEALADGLGNVRLSAVTVGLSGDFTSAPPSTTPPAAAPAAATPVQVIVFIRASYDAANARRWFHTMGQPVRPFDGVPGAEVGPEVLLLMPSDHLMVMAAARDRAYPTAAVAKALADGKGTLAASTGPVAAWLRAADLSEPVWGIGYVTAADRAAGLPAGVDWVSVQSRRADEASLDVRASATGTPAEAVHRVAADVRQMVAELKRAGGGGGEPALSSAVLLRRLAASAALADTGTGAELRLRLGAADFFAAAAAGVTVEK